MNQNTYTRNGSKIPIEKDEFLRYIPSDELKEAVNLALILEKRPLLLMGEPGVGKTLLAKAIACEWYPEDFDKHFFEWNIKSTSKAQDGLYRYNAISRLADAQIYKNVKDRQKLDNTKLGEKDSYFQLGVLAKAIKNSTIEHRSVLLIDEIDKADIDFPNDLLHELDKFEFTIPETGEEIKKPNNFKHPLVIITSNQEKELPPAFLRRCIYFYIDFPKEEQLNEILAHHYTGESAENIEFAVKTFIEVRTQIEKRIAGTEKKISTSELVDWYGIINNLKHEKNPSEEGKKILEKANLWLQKKDLKDLKNIPFYQVLFKNIETRSLFANFK